MDCSSCWDGVCGLCHGIKKIVWGALLLLNFFVWPQWGVAWEGSGWFAWFGVLLVIGGILKAVKPACGHCSTGMEKKKK